MYVYVLGAVTGGMDDAKELFRVYKEQLGSFAELNDGGSFSEDIEGTPIETMQFKGSKDELFTRAVQSVEQAELIVADMSQISTGAGIELGMAYMMKKKIVVFAKRGSRVSGVIAGMIGEQNIVWYKDYEDLAEKIRSNQTIHDVAATIRY